MANLNKVILEGNLGRDPELRHTQTGKAVVTFSLATTDGKTKDAPVEWHTVIFWDKAAETINQYAQKGSRIYVEGRIQTRKWQDANGNDRYSTEIVGKEFQFCGGKPDAEKEKPAEQTPVKAAQAPAAPFDDEIPF